MPTGYLVCCCYTCSNSLCACAVCREIERGNAWNLRVPTTLTQRKSTSPMDLWDFPQNRVSWRERRQRGAHQKNVVFA